MNLAQKLVRKLQTIRYPSPIVSKTLVCRKSTNQAASSSSSSSSSSDSDDDIKKKKLSSNEAAARLNTLLQEMVTTGNKSFSELKLAQPKNKRLEGRKEKQKQTEAVVEPAEKQVVKAVKNVAESLGGDTKQTESELLMKLSNPVENSSVSNTSLSDILKGMKIEREVKKPQLSRAEQVRTALNKMSTRPGAGQRQGDQNQRRPRQPRMPMSIAESQELQNVDLFSGESLGIFTNSSDLKDSKQIPTWQKLHERELKLAITHPPANYFQQVILWTEQGKFWQFPIDNEFGLEEESKVYFADHIFLEQHLEPWCPTRGPIRHFMELVCVGLSKNNYLTVEAKKEHIEWFKNYFEEKKQLLQEVGAMGSALGDQPKQQSIDKE